MQRGQNHEEAAGLLICRSPGRPILECKYKAGFNPAVIGLQGRRIVQKTPLYEEHGASGGKVVDFHGWALPVQYAGILQEHAHTREHASIFDCSHMGEFVIQGA
ncbi:MAG: hypothetical protein KJ052_20320, partial [Candidatus Hydrogenedentes bacterium]|nr:hypothetical protein [Candidatus Hydrogenedentota bacterium]